MSGLKLKLKNTNRPVNQSTNNNDSRDRVIEFKNVNQNGAGQEKVNLKYTKKEEVKKKSNKYFYKVSNHHELFKIGRSFYTDYLSGVKSFAISSTGYQTSQQKSILGLASFFDHKEDIKIAIVSDNLSNGAFKEIVSISKKVEADLFGLDDKITIHSFHNHFEFIDMDQLLDLANDTEIESYDEVFSHVMDMYDVIFWDVPDLHKIQLESERYFTVIMNFESISIVVAQSLSKKSDIEEIKKFFLGYGINLKGLLLEQNLADKDNVDKTKVEKKIGGKTSLWRRLFK